MCYILLIHSYGHWCCFHLLAIVDSAAMNIGTHISLPDFTFKSFVELLSYKVICFFQWWH
jgi:hypothetical protein